VQRRYKSELPALLHGYELDDEERSAILAGDIGKLYVLGFERPVADALRGAARHAVGDYIEAMREGVRKYGPVRAGIYAMTTSTTRE